MQGPGSAPQYMAPSFNNVQPRTREERALAGDKTHLEKMRIGARPGHSQPPGNVLIPVPNSALYIDEHSRFAARDAAALEHARRQEQLQKKEAVLEQKRAENYYRNEKYWNNNLQVLDKIENRYATKREAGEGGVKRNKSSACYNILTLDYEKSPQGQALQYKDQTTVYKAAVRAQNLYGKTHTVSHNIITGQPVWQPPQPQRPIPPWEK